MQRLRSEPRASRHVEAGRAGARLFLVLLLILPASALANRHLAAADLTAQSLPPEGVVVLGTVFDRTQNAPVPHASLHLEWADDEPDEEEHPDEERPRATTSTDEDGGFIFPELPKGLYRLTVEALGYQTLSQEVRVDGVSPFTLTVRLVPDAIELEGLVATTPTNPWLKERGFYERRMRGLGTSYTGEELRDLQIYHVTDLFRMLAGVSLASGRSPSSPIVQFRRGCRPDVVIDGFNQGPNVRIDDLVLPGDVQGIEIYRTATVPATYSASSCGAILIWTLGAAPEDGRPWTWRRAGVALVLILTGYLVVR